MGWGLRAQGLPCRRCRCWPGRSRLAGSCAGVAASSPRPAPAAAAAPAGPVADAGAEAARLLGGGGPALVAVDAALPLRPGLPVVGARRLTLQAAAEPAPALAADNNNRLRRAVQAPASPGRRCCWQWRQHVRSTCLAAVVTVGELLVSVDAGLLGAQQARHLYCGRRGQAAGRGARIGACESEVGCLPPVARRRSLGHTLASRACRRNTNSPGLSLTTRPLAAGLLTAGRCLRSGCRIRGRCRSQGAKGWAWAAPPSHQPTRRCCWRSAASFRSSQRCGRAGSGAGRAWAVPAAGQRPLEGSALDSLVPAAVLPWRSCGQRRGQLTTSCRPVHTRCSICRPSRAAAPRSGRRPAGTLRCTACTTAPCRRGRTLRSRRGRRTARRLQRRPPGRGSGAGQVWPCLLGARASLRELRQGWRGGSRRRLPARAAPAVGGKLGRRLRRPPPFSTIARALRAMPGARNPGPRGPAARHAHAARRGGAPEPFRQQRAVLRSHAGQAQAALRTRAHRFGLLRLCWSVSALFGTRATFTLFQIQ